MSLSNKFFEDGFEVTKIIVAATTVIGRQRARTESIKICLLEEVDVDLIFKPKKGKDEIHHINWEKLINSIEVEGGKK